MKILFVGGFSSLENGSIGGTVFACRSLLSSSLSEKVDWLLLDYTMESLPPPSLVKRLYNSSKRMLLLINYLLNKQVDGVLIFSSTGLSFLEKGLMARIAFIAGKKVYFSPRSGNMESLIRNSRLFRYIVKWVFQGCNRVLCQSSRWKDIYQGSTNLPREKFVIIPNWIDTRLYDQGNKNILSDQVKCLFLGALIAKKGIFDLIDAMIQRKDDLKNVIFYIAGEGPDKDHLQDLISHKGLSSQVKLLGWIGEEQKNKMLKDADIFVLPSYAEGLPNSLLEAMASGCACVATNVGGVPELVLDKSCGILISPGDTMALANSLVYLVNNPEERYLMGLAAKKRVQKEYDIQKAAEKFLSVFNGDNLCY